VGLLKCLLGTIVIKGKEKQFYHKTTHKEIYVPIFLCDQQTNLSQGDQQLVYSREMYDEHLIKNPE